MRPFAASPYFVANPLQANALAETLFSEDSSHFKALIDAGKVD